VRGFDQGKPCGIIHHQATAAIACPTKITTHIPTRRAEGAADGGESWVIGGSRCGDVDGIFQFNRSSDFA
jgi:hypothetical protein